MSTKISIRPLTMDLQRIAIEELNEVPERIPNDLEALRDWIKQQPHLKARTDDQFLLGFLRGSKFSLEKAKTKIDRFYTLRTKFPEIFRVDDVDEILDILRMGVCCYMLKPLNDNGPSLCIMRLGAYPADKYNFGDAIHMAQVFLAINLLENDYANVNGVILLLDFANVTVSHALQMTPSIMKKAATWTEEAVPTRTKAQHFINIPNGFERIVNMGKSMMSKKQQERLIFHSNLESLHQHLPKKYLPIEYSGENGNVKDIIDHWEQRVLSYRDYFKDELNYGTDESLRPGKPINFDNIFGVEGSFRRIEVD